MNTNAPDAKLCALLGLSILLVEYFKKRPPKPKRKRARVKK